MALCAREPPRVPRDRPCNGSSPADPGHHCGSRRDADIRPLRIPGPRRRHWRGASEILKGDAVDVHIQWRPVDELGQRVIDGLLGRQGGEKADHRGPSSRSWGKIRKPICPSGRFRAHEQVDDAADARSSLVILTTRSLIGWGDRGRPFAAEDTRRCRRRGGDRDADVLEAHQDAFDLPVHGIAGVGVQWSLLRSCLPVMAGRGHPLLTQQVGFPPPWLDATGSCRPAAQQATSTGHPAACRPGSCEPLHLHGRASAARASGFNEPDDQQQGCLVDARVMAGPDAVGLVVLFDRLAVELLGDASGSESRPSGFDHGSRMNSSPRSLNNRPHPQSVSSSRHTNRFSSRDNSFSARSYSRHSIKAKSNS